MDSATAAAFAAIAVSAVAMFTALAQALQQYLITGQLIRLCDSVVFGHLPGQGRRFWEPWQFRFRVVYKIPQIGLPPDFWPSSAAPSFAQVELPLPNLLASESEKKILTRAVLPMSNAQAQAQKTYWGKLFKPRAGVEAATRICGEASWASFCRVVYHSCHASIGYSFAEEDADRCPYDLPTVPMQMSLRDVIVMALMAGLECTSASFDSGSVSMQGTAGTITSSKHPVLGPTIHFSPKVTKEKHGVGSSGSISKDWLWRAMGNCIVAGRHYNWRGRRTVEKEIGKFLKGQGDRNIPTQALARYTQKRHYEFHQGTAESGLSKQDKTRSSPSKSRPQAPLQPRGDDGLWQLVTLSEEHTNLNKARHTAVSEPPQPDFKIQRPGGIPQKHLAHEIPRADRPTWTRMSRKHLSIETLKAHRIDYEFDQDPDYILLKRWVPEYEQDILWTHTKALRSKRNPITSPTNHPFPERIERRKDLNLIPHQTDSSINSSQKAADSDSDSASETNDMSGSISNSAEGGPNGKSDPISSLDDDSEPTTTSVFTIRPQYGSELASEPSNFVEVNDVQRPESVHVPQRQATIEDEEEPVEPSKESSSSFYSKENSNSDTSLRLGSTNIFVEDRSSSRKQRKSNESTTGDHTVRIEERAKPIQNDLSTNVSIKTDDMASTQETRSQASEGIKQQRSAEYQQKPHLDWTEESEAMKRKMERDIREEERAKRISSSTSLDSLRGDINWFWLSQTDILPGFWATPWRVFEELKHQTCKGATEVMMESISKHTKGNGINPVEYINSTATQNTIGTLRWIDAGKSTFPAYAYLAKGGIVCEGQYVQITQSAFSQPIPAVDVLISGGKSWAQTSQERCRQSIIELMRLDAWLSIVGRTPEIQNGRTNLLKQTPAIVQAVMQEFEIDFLGVDLSNEDGGAQMNREIGECVIDFLKDNELEESEALYVLVAVLRTVKVGQCILGGPDSRMLIEILEKDVQVYLV